MFSVLMNELLKTKRAREQEKTKESISNQDVRRGPKWVCWSGREELLSLHNWQTAGAVSLPMVCSEGNEKRESLSDTCVLLHDTFIIIFII